jgi:hypothetical protein
MGRAEYPSSQRRWREYSHAAGHAGCDIADESGMDGRKMKERIRTRMAGCVMTDRLTVVVKQTACGTARSEDAPEVQRQREAHHRRCRRRLRGERSGRGIGGNERLSRATIGATGAPRESAARRQRRSAHTALHNAPRLRSRPRRHRDPGHLIEISADLDRVRARGTEAATTGLRGPDTQK